MKTKTKSTNSERATKDVERTCITVPGKTRRRMLKFQRTHVVNWSEVATNAFRRYMKENQDEDV